MPAEDLPADQLDLPIAFNMNGLPVSLRRLISAEKDPSILASTELSPEQRADLAARRIEAQPKFEVVMLGVGVVDKARAIREVRDQTAIGKVLIEIEFRVIRTLYEMAGL